MGDSIVWITGATQGIGAALARSVPYAGARVINIARRQHPDLETLRADLTDPGSWDRIIDHVGSELASFRGERAIFINNAYYSVGIGFAGMIDPNEQRKQVYANAAAPLVLGDAFVHACNPRFESGLVMISSATARHAMEAHAVYGAAKAAMEQWVRAVRAERRRLGVGPWVIAIRPGVVLTDDFLERHAGFEASGEDYPGRPAVEAAVKAGKYLTPDESARQIWGLLPPDPNGRNVLYIGEMAEGAFIDTTSPPRP
jgi:NAD(P)-dependent dehydrogenase (short-subunit alcohol dehydrogenase family)